MDLAWLRKVSIIEQDEGAEIRGEPKGFKLPISSTVKIFSFPAVSENQNFRDM